MNNPHWHFPHRKNRKKNLQLLSYLYQNYLLITQFLFTYAVYSNWRCISWSSSCQSCKDEVIFAASYVLQRITVSSDVSLSQIYYITEFSTCSNIYYQLVYLQLVCFSSQISCYCIYYIPFDLFFNNDSSGYLKYSFIWYIFLLITDV